MHARLIKASKLIFASPAMSKEGGGITPRPLVDAISEPLEIKGYALETFPENDLATRWRFQTIFDTYQKFNMAARKPEMLRTRPNTRYLHLYYNYK